MATFPEIPIAEADPATRTIYRKLMTAAGSGSPALIFRHMATYPGLLDWVWVTVGEDLEAGWPSKAVSLIVENQPRVLLPAFGEGEMAANGIDAAARESIGHMLTSYNRMNPVNLIAVGAARALIAGEDLPPPPFPFSEHPAPAPAPPPDLPPPLPVSAIDDRLNARIADICRTIPKVEIGGSDVDVTPTMYRHFAIWPDFMHSVADRLDLAMEEIDTETLGFAAACRPLIAQLLQKAKARNSGPAPLDDPAPLLNVLDTFAYVIPHMVVVGEALERALDK